MTTLGIELSDSGLLTAACDTDEPRLVEVADRAGAVEWPGFAYADGTRVDFGRAAEDQWFVHPRRVVHNFWERLSLEPSTLQVGTRAAPYSELAFLFLREFTQRLAVASSPLEKLVLALPGAYLKDPAVEEEKIGLLLGMATELELPLAGLIDRGIASLCDPRAGGFSHAMPVVVIDVGLDSTDFTLCSTEERLRRRDFIQVPQAGLAQLLKQLTGTMGNRFLRHTAFDILEDGRIEQTFFRQTKEFLVSDAQEWRYQINTTTRGYEMPAKRAQLVSDAHVFVDPLVETLRAFLHNAPEAAVPCTLAMTDRALLVPGLESRLREQRLGRILHLPRGAAAAGAARIGASRLEVAGDLTEVPVETSVPLGDTKRLVSVEWDARLHKPRAAESRPVPTHAILDGIGHAVQLPSPIRIGLPEDGAELELPAGFTPEGDCGLELAFQDGRLWFIDESRSNNGHADAHGRHRTPVEAGDRLVIRCGTAMAEVLFAHCRTGAATRHN
jgi:hypothetical protein